MGDHHISNETAATQNRRTVLKQAGTLGIGALAAAGSIAGMSQEAGAQMDHHHHHTTGNDEMTEALHNCLQAGQACIAHCIELIKAGDNSIVDCLKISQEAVAFCSGHAYMSAADSKYLDDMCKLSIKICTDCKAECEKHSQHAQCKASAEACAKCIEVCKKHLNI